MEVNVSPKKTFSEAEQRSLEDLCDLIESNKVIPVIGFDLFDSAFDDKKGSRDIDLLSTLAENYDKPLCETVRQNLPIMSGFDLLNALYYSINGSQRDGFRVKISKIITSLREEVDPVPECFEQLARIKPFRFYINATIFNSLQAAVSTFKVRKPLDNEKSTYGVVSYDSQGDDMRGDQADFFYDYKPNDFSTRYFSKPVICNLLGTHDKSSGYVLTDVHYMELLVKMLTNEESSMFPKLKCVLEGAALLLIGCDFPDWILRFFLRFCIGSSMLNKGSLEKSFLIEDLADEHSKAFLIGNYGIKKFNGKPDVFIDRLYTELKKRDKNNRNNRNIEDSIFNNRVFISYNRDDLDLARKINEQLQERHIDTFFDENPDPGEGLSQGVELDATIKQAIDDSSHFLGIVTNNTNKAITNADNTERQPVKKYYKREWNYAVEKKDVQFVHPIVTSDYNGYTLFEKDILTDKAIKVFLSEEPGGERFVKRQVVSPPDYELSEDFVKKLKREQYKQRLSGK